MAVPHYKLGLIPCRASRRLKEAVAGRALVFGQSTEVRALDANR